MSQNDDPEKGSTGHSVGRLLASNSVAVTLVGLGLILVIGNVISGNRQQDNKATDAATTSNLDTDYNRNSYATYQECVADYDAQVCTQRPQGASGGIPGFIWLGPWYRTDWRTNGLSTMAGPGRMALQSPDATVRAPVETYNARADRGSVGSYSQRRGGFGSSGRSFGARGG